MENTVVGISNGKGVSFIDASLMSFASFMRVTLDDIIQLLQEIAPGYEAVVYRNDCRKVSAFAKCRGLTVERGILMITLVNKETRAVSKNIRGIRYKEMDAALAKALTDEGMLIVNS